VTGNPTAELAADQNSDGWTVHRSYPLDVRVLAGTGEDGGHAYRFEAPDHAGTSFEDPETATLYADVYFDTNGFVERGTGTRGVPPTVILAGRDTLVAYLMTREHADRDWIASFIGEEPERVERYVASVRRRAEEIRNGARDLGIR